MNNKDKRILMEFPSALDDAIFEKFGVESSSRFDMFGTGTYVTNFECDNPILTANVRAFMQGFMAGNLELRSRLERE